MQSPITLMFRHIERTGGLEASAREIAQRLLRFNERITQCHVLVEGRAVGESQAPPYSVKIHLSVPSAQIHAGSLLDGSGQQSDVYTALREAFNDAKRQLQELQVDQIRPCLSGEVRARAAAAPTTTPTRAANSGRGHSSLGLSLIHI